MNRKFVLSHLKPCSSEHTEEVRFLFVLLLICPPALAATPTPLLGAKQSVWTARFGKVRAEYRTLKDQYMGAVYCVGGQYLPDIFTQGIGWEKSSKLAPLESVTNGPCEIKGGDAPLSVFVRFEGGLAVSAAYAAPHGNTYDRGWITFLDDLLVGKRLKPVNQNKEQSTEYVKTYGYSTYPNKVVAQAFFPNDGGSFTGIVWALNLDALKRSKSLLEGMVLRYGG